MPANRLILGTANLGLDGGREGAFALLDAYAELGGAEIDTAAVYSDWVPGETGRSETITGEWMAMRGNRERLTVITKGAHPPLSDMTIARLDPDSIRHDVEQSLRRLQTDRIDLYFLHRDDPAIPAADILGTLATLRDEGKLVALGCSNWRLPRILESQRVAGAGFAANQVLGNALCRLMTPPADPTNVTLTAPMFHHAVDTSLALQLYTSQCQGLFEKRRRGAPPPRNYDNPACAEAVTKIEQLATGLGLDASHLILAYLTALAPNVRPVIGPRTAEQVHHSYAAGAMALNVETVVALAAATGMQDFLRA